MIDRAAHALLDVARVVLADLDLEVVLQRVLGAARDLTGAEYAAIGVLDSSGTGLARFITAGLDDATRADIGAPPRGRGVLGELIREPVPLRLQDVGSHPRSYGFPANHPPMETFVGVPVVVAGKPYGNLYLTDKEGGEQFTEDDEEALVLLAEFAGVAIDHARRFTGSEARRDELQKTVDALDATMQISRALGGQTDLDVILELVAKRGRALVSARALVIELLRDDELVVAAAAGELPDALIGRHVPLQDTVASAALRTHESQHFKVELNRLRFEQHGLGRLGLQATGGLVVPLVFGGRTYGALVALDRLQDGPHFSAEDERLLEAFATSAATAVATATSVAADRRAQRLAATELERGRWARELHDETLQGLAALRLGLAAARRVGTHEALDEAVEEAVAQLGSEVANLRALITDLRPAALDELGTAAAIRGLAERAARNDLDVDVSVDLRYEEGRHADRHTPELEIAIYRIVQEALTNAQKHGRARRAVVEVVEDDTSVCVSVRDDGTGFDTAEATNGFGLVGMRERVELLGGMLTVASAPGEATTITARMPARRRGAELAAADVVARRSVGQ
jgi:signal transduction histidine kinase